MSPASLLLALHIAGGTIALVAGVSAILVQALRAPHRLHVVAGRTFVGGQLAVVVSALPLSVIVRSPLLAMIGVFAGYELLTGWRYARNRSGAVTRVDHALVVVIVAASIAMISYGVHDIDDNGVVLLVFGLVAAFLGALHVRELRGEPPRGRARIAAHLRMMLAAYIATLTAFVVVNVDALGLVGWFLPTLLVTPVLVVWSRRVKSGEAGVSRPDTLIA